VIQVSLSVLVFICLGGILVSVFGAWVLWEWRRQRRERRAFRHVLKCVICAFEFEDQSSAPLPRCPRCGSLNERHRVSRI
jgi:uncharacterized paraquat-inducible protein A